MRPLAFLHAWLRVPGIYSTVMGIMGADMGFRALVQDHCKIKAGDRVLDLGCGPGLLYRYLPPVDYLGLDHDNRYLEHARARNPGVRFEWCDVTDVGVSANIGHADLILAVGLLHHLSDPQAARILTFGAGRLRPGGRLITVDPAFEPGQAQIARMLARADRGRFVRSGRAYLNLANAAFPRAKLTLRDDLLRLPYTHAIVECCNS